MPSIDQARQHYLAKEEPQEAQSGVHPKAVYVVWEEAEIKHWSRTHDIITAGQDGDGGFLVKDARFKNGSKAGWTVYEMANGKTGDALPASSRGYLRWFYVKLAVGITSTDIADAQSAEGMKRLVRTALGESHEAILEKANADDNFSR